MTPQTLKKVGPSTLIESPGDTEKGVSIITNDTPESKQILPDFDMVNRYLDALTGSNESVTFQLFDDKKENKRLAEYRNIERGPSYPYLSNRQSMGAGIFIMVNAGDGKGRSEKNVTKIRALFIDLDGSPYELAAGMLKPHIRVESSPGRWHLYWLVSDCSREQFKPLQQAIARQFDGDKSCHDLPRVLRVPGFYHMKTDTPFLTRLVETNGFPAYTTQQIIEGLGLNEASTSNEKASSVDLYEVKEGGRNDALTRLAGSWLNHHKGLTLPELVDMASLWNKGLANPLPLEELTRTCKSIFDKHHDTPRLKTVSIEALLQHDFPVLAYLLYPILHTQSLNMIHAWRGIGKTFFGLCLAYAVASGGSFLKWRAEKPRGVLYLDGEMPGNSLQARLAGIIDSNENEPPPGFFQVLTPDLQEPGNMPDLSTPEGQAALDALVTPDTALIVVDNLSCFLRSGRENESESWLPVQGWALRHRAAGRTVLFIHHSGKGGTQRGSSKKEDVLDLVLNLKRPIDYEPSQGACFEVVFEKSRHLTGADTTSFEATLSTDEHGKQSWLFKDVTETTFERVISLANEGLSQADIAGELGINKSSVCRHIRKGKEQGKLSEKSKVA